jgi:hypothetical protein
MSATECEWTDDVLLHFATEFRHGVLESRASDLMCFAVAAPLESLLAMFGYRTTLEEVWFPHRNHCWLRLADGRILDPTADQFGLAPVYLGDVPALYTRWMAEGA